jgi:hypothetical protein
LRQVALLGRAGERVDHLEQPVFAWRWRPDLCAARRIPGAKVQDPVLMRTGAAAMTMRDMEPPPTTSEAGRHATVRSDKHRLQIDAVGRIAGPTMSSAAAALLRAIGEAAAMALMCPSTVLKAEPPRHIEAFSSTKPDGRSTTSPQAVNERNLS